MARAKTPPTFGDPLNAEKCNRGVFNGKFTADAIPPDFLKDYERPPLITGVPTLDSPVTSTNSGMDDEGKFFCRYEGGFKQVTIVAGQANIGKSTYVGQVIMNIMRKHPGAVTTIFSREDGMSLDRLRSLAPLVSSPKKRFIGTFLKEEVDEILGKPDDERKPEDFGSKYRVQLLTTAIDTQGFWEFVYFTYRDTMANLVGVEVGTKEDPNAIADWKFSDAELEERINKVPPHIIVVDPWTSLLPRENFDSNRMGMLRAKANNVGLSYMLGRLKLANIHLIFIAHPNNKVDLTGAQYAPPVLTGPASFAALGLTLPGGNAVLNYANTILLCSKGPEWGSEDYGKDANNAKTNVNYGGGGLSGNRIIIRMMKGRECPSNYDQIAFATPTDGSVFTITAFEFLIKIGVITGTGNYWIPGMQKSVTRKVLGQKLRYNPEFNRRLAYLYVTEMEKDIKRFKETSSIGSAGSFTEAVPHVRSSAGLAYLMHLYSDSIPDELLKTVKTEWSPAQIPALAKIGEYLETLKLKESGDDFLDPSFDVPDMF